MFASVSKTTIAATAAMILSSAVQVNAEFTSVCPEVCFKGSSLLVTKCTVDGTTSDTSFKWSQFDLNQILYYNSGLPGLQYLAK